MNSSSPQVSSLSAQELAGIGVVTSSPVPISHLKDQKTYDDQLMAKVRGLEPPLGLVGSRLESGHVDQPGIVDQ